MLFCTVEQSSWTGFFYLAGSPRGGSTSAQNKFIMGAIQWISESAYYFIQHYSMLLPRPIGRHDEIKHMSFQTQINHYWLIRIAERHFIVKLDDVKNVEIEFVVQVA